MRLNVAILGSGNIGTDLLLKCLKMPWIEVSAFVGRRLDSEGMKIAKEKGVVVSDQGIDYFLSKKHSGLLLPDVVFDCTNADDAKKHAIIFQNLNIKVIDLTPAKVGELVVPIINGEDAELFDNVNMITCGGQTSIPIIYEIFKNCHIRYVEVVSQIASNSAGMATRENIDSYIETTERAIKKFTGCQNVKVILNLNPAVPCVDMQTTVFIKSSDFFESYDTVYKGIIEVCDKMKNIISGYELTMPPTIVDGILVIGLKVKGSGDYLPPYAGNLDIINHAAIAIAKKIFDKMFGVWKIQL